jgi:hypothetical protein
MSRVAASAAYEVKEIRNQISTGETPKIGIKIKDTPAVLIVSSRPCHNENPNPSF